MMEITVSIRAISSRGYAKFISTIALVYVTFNLRYGIVDTVAGINFNYNRSPLDRNGVYNWAKIRGTQCNGINQSPVNIMLDEIEDITPSCMCPKLSYNTTIAQGVFKNNGHAPSFTLASNSSVTLSSVPNENGLDTYRLHDFHFHYGGVQGVPFDPQDEDQPDGSEDNGLYSLLTKHIANPKGKMANERMSSGSEHTVEGVRYDGEGKKANERMSSGSEHTVEGVRFDGELHFVFYNTKYGMIKDAMYAADGLVVMSFIIQQVPDDQPTLSADTRHISEFLQKNIPNILHTDQNVTTSVDLSMFFNNRPCEYYTYRGSTTTPLCAESVRWIIFRDYMKITRDAWYTLSGLASTGNFNRRYGNYRELQPMDGRLVQRNCGQMDRCGTLI